MFTLYTPREQAAVLCCVKFVLAALIIEQWIAGLGGGLHPLALCDIAQVCAK